MDEVTGMIWTAVLSLVVAPLVIIIGAQVKELRRIDILLNRTREELYVADSCKRWDCHLGNARVGLSKA